MAASNHSTLIGLVDSAQSKAGRGGGSPASTLPWIALLPGAAASGPFAIADLASFYGRDSTVGEVLAVAQGPVAGAPGRTNTSGRRHAGGTTRFRRRQARPDAPDTTRPPLIVPLEFAADCAAGIRLLREREGRFGAVRGRVRVWVAASRA
jgi:hypothetical protein